MNNNLSETKKAADEPQLKVGAHVLTQLGKELVTDQEQALLELVKNAYDADSPRCEIIIDTYATGTLEQTGPRSKFASFCEDTEAVKATFRNVDQDTTKISDADITTRTLTYTGSITVRDKGIGLSPKSVTESWLVVSNSIKRVAQGKPKPKTKKRLRTPLGDKGLGRLGTMRLGDILHLRSAREGDKSVTVAWFRWKDCEGAETLDRIPVEVSSEPNHNNFFGTEVIVYGINDVSEWRNLDRARQLSYSIASIVSPFEAVKTFPVSVRIDGLAYEMEQVTDDLLNQAVSDFDFKFKVDDNGDGMLTMKARFRRSVFLASTKEEAIERAKRVFGMDEGAAFLKWLDGQDGPEGMKGSRKLAKYDNVEVSPKEDWIIEICDSIPFSKIVRKWTSQISIPGDFNGALYYFNFGKSRQSVTGGAATREKFKRLKGVAILRDGFRVRAGEDWLDLARSMTSGSTYHLRVDNTAGYFALSGEKNYMLTEKSDRENFVEDMYYRGFLAISVQCKNFANKATEDIRRGLDEYAKLSDRQETGASTMTTPTALTTINKTVKAIGAASKAASNMVIAQRNQLDELDDDQDSLFSGDHATRAIALAKSGISTIEKLTKDIDKMRDLAAAGTIVAQQIELRSDQVAALVESAAVGLAARGLTHEMHTHLSEIERSTHAVRTIISKTEYANTVMPHLRHIDLARRTIAGAASQIDPMLPRTRAVKEKIPLRPFIEKYFAAREAELQREGITANIIEEQATTVLMNRNRLLQVLDNLVANSRYWLQDHDAPMPGSRKIEVVVDALGIVVFDNGPGVESKLEDSLFDLFVSEKPAEGPGQGLGLYIVMQLLELDACSVELLPTQNVRGNRYQFRVDLKKLVINESD